MLSLTNKKKMVFNIPSSASVTSIGSRNMSSMHILKLDSKCKIVNNNNEGIKNSSYLRRLQKLRGCLV